MNNSEANFSDEQTGVVGAEKTPSMSPPPEPTNGSSSPSSEPSTPETPVSETLDSKEGPASFEKAERKYSRKKTGKKALLLLFIILILSAGIAALLYFLPISTEKPKNDFTVNSAEEFGEKMVSNLALSPSEKEPADKNLEAEMLEYIKKNQTSNPNEASVAKNYLSQLYAEQGRLDEAITLLEEDLDQSTNSKWHTVIYSRLADYCEKKGDAECQKKYIEKFLASEDPQSENQNWELAKKYYQDKLANLKEAS